MQAKTEKMSSTSQGKGADAKVSDVTDLTDEQKQDLKLLHAMAGGIIHANLSDSSPFSWRFGHSSWLHQNFSVAQTPPATQTSTQAAR